MIWMITVLSVLAVAVALAVVFCVLYLKAKKAPSATVGKSVESSNENIAADVIEDVNENTDAPKSDDTNESTKD